MAGQIRVIHAGSHPVYEIVPGDVVWVIREAENHEHHVELIKSVVPTVIDSLQEAWRESQGE